SGEQMHAIAHGDAVLTLGVVGLDEVGQFFRWVLLGSREQRAATTLGEERGGRDQDEGGKATDISHTVLRDRTRTAHYTKTLAATGRIGHAARSAGLLDRLRSAM